MTLPVNVVELLQDISGPCDTRDIGPGRRYWCSTHMEYGTGDGCAGERARKILKEHGVEP